MKTVFALASLFVAVQAMPQAGGADAEPPVPTLPACLDPCVKAINADQCKDAVGTFAQAQCACKNQAVLAGCAVSYLSVCGGIDKLTGAQNDASSKCPAVIAFTPKATPNSAAASATATASASGSGSAAATETSAAAGGSGSGSGSGSATETAAATTGEETPANSSGAAASGEVASSTVAGSGASNSTASPKATSSNSAANHLAVGGSVLLAGFAALLAL